MNQERLKIEKDIENELLQKLEQLGYKKREDIKNISDIEQNFKQHLERINKNILNNEKIENNKFQSSVLKNIKNKSLIENSKLLRDKIRIEQSLDFNDLRLDFFDKNDASKNIFEFSHQVSLSSSNNSREGNRGDVTIFMNGIPIVQIELKKNGVDINEAFNQINRYKKQSFDNNSIFKMLQIFIVSNSTITKFFANSSEISKKFMFDWSDKDNNKPSNILDFAEEFLKIDTLFKMITNYMIVNDDITMVLRPYQYYAVESVLNHYEKSKLLNSQITDLDERQKILNGFVWHATGSGKTVTSFKTAQLLSSNKDVEKVVFLVDRLDLNVQTFKEFKKFMDDESEDDLKESKNCKILYQQLNDNNRKIIITTIQKLSRLLKSENDNYKLDQNLLSKNFVFIIDECHRTQFGEMHKSLKRAFTKSILIGFTGTPIFEGETDNYLSTEKIFGKNLHKYMMIDAINDKNVLKFNIEYCKGIENKMEPSNDVQVEAIDEDGFFKSDKYLDLIVDYIYKINKIKTKDSFFSSMLVTADIETAVRYFYKFREKYPDFKVAALFSESDKNNEYDEDVVNKTICLTPDQYKMNFNNSKVSSDTSTNLEKVIVEYNKLYNKNYSKKDFKAYSNNIQNELSIDNKFGHPTIEMVIVVRMLTTGFNAKYLNTVYLDRRMKGYEVIQTISRANRIGHESKDIANIVSFRTHKNAIDSAIALYNNSSSLSSIVSNESLEDVMDNLNTNLEKLKIKWPTIDSILNCVSDVEKKEFIELMKTINRLLIHAKSFIKFNQLDVNISIEDLESYRSVMKSFKNLTKVNKDSILAEVDFNLDILVVDEINTDYILKKLTELNGLEDKKPLIKELEKISSKIKASGLSSKYDLINELIEATKSKLNDDKSVDIWNSYIDLKIEKVEPKIEDFAKNFGIDENGLNKIIKMYDEGKKNDKTINDFENEIIDSIINKEIGILEKRRKIEETKNFILSLESDYS